LLRQLRNAAEAQLGELGSRLVIGRPVHFSGAKDSADDEFAVSRLRRAFACAGFDDVYFLPGPVADAALKYQRDSCSGRTHAGGSSRRTNNASETSFVPAIRKLFEGIFGAVPIRAGEEFTSVAEGLALFALELA
jgi:hypothetical protein